MIVMSEPPLSAATEALRALVASFNGIKPVARLMGVDTATVATWTRKGVPKKHAKGVLKLGRVHSAGPPGRSQNPRYAFSDTFSITSR